MRSTIEFIRTSVFSTDKRGWVIDPVDNSVFDGMAVKNLHIVSMTPGSVRGNHVHRSQREFICVLGGPVLVVYQDTDGSPGERQIDSNTRPFIIRIPSGVAHALKNVGPDVVFLLCYSDQKFDPNDRDAKPTHLI